MGGLDLSCKKSKLYDFSFSFPFVCLSMHALKILRACLSSFGFIVLLATVCEEDLYWHV